MMDTQTKRKTYTARVKTSVLREALMRLPAMSKSSIPMLNQARLDFEKTGGKLTVTNLENLVSIEFEASCDEPFSVILPKGASLTFLSGNNSTTTITLEGKTLKLELDKVGSVRFTDSYDMKDYPNNLPKPDDGAWTEIPDAKWFLKLLRSALLSRAKEESRPVLTGVHFKEGAMATADGFRLTVARSEKLKFGLGTAEAIVNGEMLDIACRLFAKAEKMEVSFQPFKGGESFQHFFMRSGSTMMTGQLIHGTYPNWNQLIPPTFLTEVNFSAPLMAQRISMISDTYLSSGIVRFIFHQTDLAEHIVDIEGGSSDEALYSFRMPVKIEKQPDGGETKIAFNKKYVTECLRQFSVCNMKLTSPSSPGVFTGDVQELTIVLMPMFVQW